MNSIKDASCRPKKVAVVIPKYGLLGGAERLVFELTERLARATDHEFTVFANRWKAAPDSRVVFRKIPRFPLSRSLRPLIFAWLVQRAIGAGRFDLVHAHDRVFHGDIVSLVCTPHRNWVRDIRKKKASLFDRSMIAVEKRMLASGQDTFFLPISSITRDAFEREYRSLPGKWQIMPPGVDFRIFSSPDRNECRAEIRARHKLKNCDFLVLFVGMNFELKGLDTVMASVAAARAHTPRANIGLIVVGKGNEEKYRAKANQLGIGEAVAFAGPVSAKIERYYRAADTLMMLSDTDTFGMVVLEAMAAALPVIIGPEVGARDLIENGINGFVLGHRHDAEVAARHLADVSSDGRQQNVACLAQKTASLHDWKVRVDEMAAIYERRMVVKSRK